ncbi:IS5 family transposase [Phyllobacterium endophyticum]|uniref:Transposase IS4-like domain-containing protein n=1 Tax=Phyllobacterium endophyticum TaxID=1149773 RepID=A0A2P7AWU1_9HYPH|nr:IS5 family transposase [Phyllobacterium endophyticum]PSH58673.1 hypothetical protein CU100_13995 [Phyllobacterium endophyticum]TYR39364.1 transposase [Phyllobacterium endophyticum]
MITTPANVNDTVPADAMISGDEVRVLADSAYHTHAREAALKAAGIRCGLMRRPNKHHPVLKPAARRFNRIIAKSRAAVETTFATLKRRMGLDTIRYVDPQSGCRGARASFAMVPQGEKVARRAG